MQGAAGRAGRPARRLGRHAGEWLGACTQPCPLSKLPQRCHARPPVLGFIFCCGTPEVSSIHVYTTEGAAPTCLMLRAPAKRVAGEPRPPPPPTPPLRALLHTRPSRTMWNMPTRLWRTTAWRWMRKGVLGPPCRMDRGWRCGPPVLPALGSASRPPCHCKTPCSAVSQPPWLCQP